MKAGIVGLPNVGKSTLFNCLSNAKAQSANFPFCTIEPNIGIVNVPDLRLEKLDELVNPKRVLPATVEIVDIAGLVKGASKGEGLGNQFLGNIRETDAILHVLRCFDDDNIIHVDGSIDPIRDKETIDIELQLKDLETADKKLEKVKRAARTGNKDAQKEETALIKVKEGLEAGISVRAIELTDSERDDFIDAVQFITDKPVMYVCNVDETSAVSGNKYVEKVKAAVANENAEVIFLAVGTESDINELEEYEERQMFLEDLGLEEAGSAKLIRGAYRLLNLQTYFTAGVKEVRAWTIPIGATAPQAAGVIHTDFEKGFIRAEVIKYNDFVSYGSEAKVKESGKLNVEGKEYIVDDGDVMHFRFNV
ncbi:MAG: redox-regulated ATPase YchF [Flavobacteriaceae bacterium]|nr:redox-regulated ATPase YchF [Flavobacteriaceae bacterium]